MASKDSIRLKIDLREIEKLKISVNDQDILDVAAMTGSAERSKVLKAMASSGSPTTDSEYQGQGVGGL